MRNIPQVSEAIHKLLTTTADTAARATNFVQRRSKMTGALFVETLVLGWLKDPKASLESLTQTSAALGVQISAAGLHYRFSQSASQCLRQVLEAAVEEMIKADPAAGTLLERFTGVYLQDSSTVVLPDELAAVWRGCGGNTPKGTSASVKLQVHFDLTTGWLGGPYLGDGSAQDRDAPIQQMDLPKGAMRIADLGYFSLEVMERLSSKEVYWLSRVQAKTVVWDDTGQRWELSPLLRSHKSDELDIAILLGLKRRLPCRLLAVRVPAEVAKERRHKLRHQARRKGQQVSKERLALADWNIFVTNAPSELLELKEAMILGKARWQVELLFKLWKSHGQIDEWRSSNPWRILCEVYAKLVAMVIQHWVLLVSCWGYLDRSMVKAAQTVRSCAMMLTMALAGIIELEEVIEQIARCIGAGCRMNKRKTRPNTYQLLMCADP